MARKALMTTPGSSVVFAWPRGQAVGKFEGVSGEGARGHKGALNPKMKQAHTNSSCGSSLSEELPEDPLLLNSSGALCTGKHLLHRASSWASST